MGFLNFTRGISNLADTGLKVGAGIGAVVGMRALFKEKKRKDSMLESNQVELQKLEIEVQKAKLLAEKQKIEAAAAAELAPEPQQFVVSAPAPQPALAAESNASSQQKLLNAYELFKQGAITEQEYEQLKMKVLGV